MARGPHDSVDALDAEALRAELQRARARLEEQRELLEEAHRHALANARFTEALGRLSRSDTLERSGLVAAFVEVIQAAAACLEVDRVGVWLADESFDRLECVALVHQGVVSRKPGTVIDRASYPAYFAAAATERVLPVPDVAEHPATAELLSGYLAPLGITSLLDAPIRVFGHVAGVVCHEHTGPRRRWSEFEQALAAHVGDFVALALEAFRREEARRAEVAAEARYRHMVEGLPVTVYRIEPGRGITYVSPHVAELTGLPPAAWSGVDGLRAWLERIHEGERDAVQERLRRPGIVADPGIDYRIRTAHPAERWVHDVAHELRGSDGAVIAIEGVLSDVTARWQAVAAVRQWEQRFAALFSRTDLSIFTVDVDRRLTFVSKALLALLGRSEPAVLGSTVEALFDAQAAADVGEALQSILGRERPELASAELTVLVAPEASTTTSSELGDDDRTLRFRLTGIPAGQPDRVVAIGIDVSAVVELAAHQHDHDKEASIVRLAAGVAHDVANLLGAIRLTARTLERSADPAVQREALEHLRRCATQATELNRQLVDVARSRPTQPRTLVVDRFLESTLPLLRGLLVPREMTLELRLDADDACVHVGETELQQILLNLVTNAAEAAPPGSRVILRSHRSVYPEPPPKGRRLRGAYVAIEVEDEGPGIAEGLRRRIFEPYFTTKGPPRPPSEPPAPEVPTGGSGLGLATSRGLARQAGGDLRAEAGERGARMVLLLPEVPQRASST